MTTDRTGTEANETLYDIYGNTKSTSGVVSLDSSTSYTSAQDLFFTATGVLTTIYLRGKTNTDIVYFDDVSVYATDAWAGTIAGYTGRYLGKSAKAALIVVETNAMRLSLSGDSPSHSTSPEPAMGLYMAAQTNTTIVGAKAVADFTLADAVSGTAGAAEVFCYF